MMIQLTDIAVLLVSLATCAYCVLLSRRLRALRSTKDGLGAAILALSKSIATMSDSTQTTRSQIEKMSSELERLIGEGERLCERVDSLTLTLDAKAAKAAKTTSALEAETAASLKRAQNQLDTHVKNMTAQMYQQITTTQVKLSDTLNELLDRSRERVIELSDLIRQVRALSAATEGVNSRSRSLKSNDPKSRPLNPLKSAG